MSVDGVNDLFAFLAPFSGFNTELDVRTLLLVVYGLAYVMQQSGTAGQRYVCAELGSHKAGEIADFERVVEHILAVACAVMQLAQQLYKLGMQVVYAGVQHGLFAFLFYDAFNLGRCLCNHFFDSGRMYTAVKNKLFKRYPGDFPSYGVKT